MGERCFYFLPLLLLKKNRVNTNTVAEGRYLPNLKELFQMGITFSLTVLAWVFFRAENLSHALNYISTIFSKSLFSIPYAFGLGVNIIILTILFIIILVIVEWFGRNKKYALEFNKNLNPFYQWALFYLILIIIFLFGQRQQDFIYFQF